MKMNSLLLLIFLFTSVPAPADTSSIEVFIDASIGAAFVDVSEPVFVPSHPVSAAATSLERSSDSSTARSLFVGVKSPSGLYAKGGYVDFGETSRFKGQFGTDGAVDFSTNTDRTEDVSAYVVVVGKSFAISDRSKLFVQAGAHRFDKDVTEQSVTTERDVGTRALLSSTSFVQRASKQDTTLTYGAGAEIDVARSLSVLVSASRYDDIDIDTVDVGLRLHF